MLLRILKRDLKRKKAMNAILFAFIMLATLLLSSSVSNLSVVTGAVNYFIEISKVPDYFALALAEGKEDAIRDYLLDSKNVSEYEVVDGLNLANEAIGIVSRADEENAEKSAYEKTNTLSVQALPDNFMKVFDQEGNPVELRNGEIALPKLEAEKNCLNTGDKIQITVGSVEQEFTVAAICRDVVFGTSFMGYKRCFVSQEDFNAFANQEGLTFTRIYCINYKDGCGDDFQKDFKAMKFNLISSANKSLIPMCYVIEMLVAGILIIVSICLILIAFLVLRFTIIFTLQEDYKEIGIMKAIGLKESGIKGIYLIKYFAIAVLAAAAGLIFSLPFGEYLLKQAVVNIVTKDSGQNIILNIASAVLVVLIVVGFCNLCADRLKKFTVMDAIRNGSDGESFGRRMLHLSRRKRMKVSSFMAVNDVLGNKKRYAILGVTFCIGTMLVMLPLFAAATLKRDDIVYYFGMWPSDGYVDTEKAEQYAANKDIDEIEMDLRELAQRIEAAGLKGNAGMQVGYMVSGYSDDPEDMYTCFLQQPVGEWKQEIKMLAGKVPQLANEIALTDITAAKMNVEIGDSISLCFGEQEAAFIVTGTYQTMMNMGEGAWVSKSAVLDPDYLSGIITPQVEIDGLEGEEAIAKLKEIFPEYEVVNTQGFLKSIIGNVIDALDSLIWAITVIVMIINALIIILMMQIFITKERGSIALLKSMGFQNRAVRSWQIQRIMAVLLISVCAGTVLSVLLAPYTIGPIFSMMGANKMEFHITLSDGSIIYPFLLFLVTSLSALLCTGAIGRIDVKEVNNME